MTTRLSDIVRLSCSGEGIVRDFAGDTPTPMQEPCLILNPLELFDLAWFHASRDRPCQGARCPLPDKRPRLRPFGVGRDEPDQEYDDYGDHDKSGNHRLPPSAPGRRH